MNGYSTIFTHNVILDIYDRIMDIHKVCMDNHDGIMDMHNCCEFWISIIIINIHDSIIDSHIVLLWIFETALWVTYLKILSCLVR